MAEHIFERASIRIRMKYPIERIVEDEDRPLERPLVIRRSHEETMVMLSKLGRILTALQELRVTPDEIELVVAMRELAERCAEQQLTEISLACEAVGLPSLKDWE